MRVAIVPIRVIAPGFFIHHAANISTEKPIMSQRNGKWNMLKNMGARIEFSIPHMDAHSAIAAMFRELK